VSLATRPPLRIISGIIVVVITALGLVACGDKQGEAQSLTFTLSGGGTKAGKIVGPQDAEAGLAEITLENDTPGDDDLQLIRVEGDHSTDEVLEGLQAAASGQATPEWFFAAGGVGTTLPNESKTVTQVLEPGTYYALTTEGSRLHGDSAAVIEVSGEASEETVDADETVEAFEYDFEAEQLSSGKAEIAFENTGAQPHRLVAARLTGAGTAEDVEQAFEGGARQPPFEAKSFQSTAVLEAGEAQLVTLDLKPGRYVLFCFISDRQGGPPHALKGMVDEVEVE
jgi:hypothetical protein